MKKKVLALVCAAVMVMGLGVTALADPSPSSESVANSGSVTNSAAPTFNLGGSQTFGEATLKGFFVEDTVVEGGVVKAVDVATAQEAISEAAKLNGENAFIATIVDINVPGATFPYNLTIKCSNVWAGQTVTILHKVNGQWERLTPSAVADNSVTVTVNSFSPFAIVIDTDASPKTSDI